MNKNNIYDTIIIGSGVAGCLSALNINNKYNVLLIEKEDENLPLTGSTYGGCYKIHSGIHYIKDLATAKLCLYKGIKFIKQYPSFYLGQYDNHHLCKSKLLIMSNSAISKDDTLYNCEQLKQYYTQLVNEDPSNNVLGDENEIIKVLPKSAYEHYVPDQIPFYDKEGELKFIHVILCIEYSEFILDFNKFKHYITNLINDSNNINRIYNYNVDNIKLNSNSNYIISSNDHLNNQYIGKSIINCSFESIECLDKQLFTFNNNNSYTRIKVTIVIPIPNSMKAWITNHFFAIGPFANFSIIQDNKMILMSERYCNVGYYKSNEPIPNHLIDVLNNCNLNNETGSKLANLILNDCAQYFKEPFKSDLLNSTILELKRGFIKIHEKDFNSSSIYNSNSGIHKRSEELNIRSNNYISNCSTKMTYSVDDSIIASNIINQYLNNTNKQ